MQIVQELTYMHKRNCRKISDADCAGYSFHKCITKNLGIAVMPTLWFVINCAGSHPIGLAEQNDNSGVIQASETMDVVLL